METVQGEESEYSARGVYESLYPTDAELLKRAWRKEKAAPQILQYEIALVQRSLEEIQLMKEKVEDLTSIGIDPLPVSLYQTDMEKTLFLLRSYLKTRLQMIEKFVFDVQKTTEMWDRLSPQEQMFAGRCTEDMEQHLEQSALSKLPNSYKSVLKQFSSN